MRMKLAFAAAAATLAFAEPAFAEHHEGGEHSATHHALMKAVASQHRGEQAERDQYRHPVETLEFFKVEPGMTVVDYYATGGWYTNILAPYLGTEGSYIPTITTLPTAPDDVKERQRSFPERFTKLSNEAFAEAGIEHAPITALNLENDVPDELKGTADRVLIFRFMHNMHRFGLAYDQLKKVRDLLKDDGLLGVVQHRAKPDAPYSYGNGTKGYMRQEDVIKLIEAHGFELIETSEINANPNDTADHEIGVWFVPPTMAGIAPGDDEGKEARKAIGESDRMTLLFKKRP